MFSQICSNCQAKDSIIDDYESGETVCTICGNILGEHLISDEYEERFFEGEENEVQRIGLPEKPETINNPSITLVIRSKGEKRIYKEYSKKDKISKNSLKIEKFCSKVDIIPAIVSQIKYLYKKLAPRQNMQGRNFNHIIIALYYHALRQLNQAKSMKEVSKMFCNVTERQIKKAYNKIKFDIPDKIDDDNDNDNNEKEDDEFYKVEKNYIGEYCAANQIRYESKLLAWEIAKDINNNNILEGKSPRTVAGLSLLLSYRLLNDNSDNSKEFFGYFSTKGTLSKCFEEIKDELHQIIPKEFHAEIDELKNTHLFI